MSKVLVVGTYTDVDRNSLQSTFDPIFIHDFDELDAMEADARAEIEAVGFKGHSMFLGDSMDKLPGLKLIANYGVGYDAIDIEAANERSIKVTNTPDVLNDAVADLTVAMMLAHTRQMEAGSNWVRTGTWPKKGELPLSRQMSGGTVGICGLGRIGREIANRLAAFKMDVHYWSRSEKDTPGWVYHPDPVSLAKAVDYYVIALVGGADTAGLVNADVLEALGPDGIIVNISRGSTVDEAALLEALENKTIAGAALDVFQNEPNIDPRFLGLDNVHLQPHQGSGTHETRAAMAKLQRDNISARLEGRDLLTPVN